MIHVKFESNHNLDTRVVHGGYGSWSDWGQCSSTCGVGLQRRDRHCDSPWPSQNGNPCFDENINYQICVGTGCKGMVSYRAVLNSFFFQKVKMFKYAIAMVELKINAYTCTCIR